MLKAGWNSSVWGGRCERVEEMYLAGKRNVLGKAELSRQLNCIWKCMENIHGFIIIHIFVFLPS